MLKYILCFYFVLNSIILLGIGDTIVHPESSFGLEIQYNNLRDRIVTSSGSSKQRIGYGLQISGFCEQRTLNNLSSSISFLFSYNEYRPDVFRRRSEETIDTVFFDHFFLDRQEIIFSLPVVFRADYIKIPKVYILFGIRPELRLFEKERYMYLDTRFKSVESVANEYFLSSDFDQPSTPSSIIFNVGIEFGIGVEINKTSFELLFSKKSWGIQVGSLGIRLRQKIEKSKNIK